MSIDKAQGQDGPNDRKGNNTMNTLELMHCISRNARDQWAAVDTIKLIWPNAKVSAHIDTARPKYDELCLVVDIGDDFAFPVLCIEHNCRTCDSYA